MGELGMLPGQPESCAAEGPHSHAALALFWACLSPLVHAVGHSDMALQWSWAVALLNRASLALCVALASLGAGDDMHPMF